MKAPLQKLELTWIGKGQEFQLEPRILLEQPELAAGDPQAENMLIHGDNLLALKALEQDFAGRIKCIYIDPPYNTGSAFDHYDDGMEHSLWLSLMIARLKLLHKLLSDDGVILVQIDDKEMAYLRVAMDQLFLRDNFLNMMTVKTSDPSGHKTVNPSPYSQTEYILMYAKNRSSYKYKQQYIASSYDVMYNQIIVNKSRPYEEWTYENLSLHVAKHLGFESSNEARKRIGKLDFAEKVGEFALLNNNKVFQFTAISDAAGRLLTSVRDESQLNPTQVFRVERLGYDDVFILGGRQVYFYSSKVKEVDGLITPAKPLTNLWTDIPYNGIASEGGVVFKNGKKPEKLVRRVIELSTRPGDWVLDSFLGSGTTAAVAHKMGRRWVGVELGDHARTHCLPRLRQVVAGTDQGGISKAVDWQGGGGFKFYTLAPSLLNKDQYDNWVISKEYNAQMLAAALAKQEGFRYQPDPHIYWKQARSSEHDFLFTTTQFVTVQTIDQLAAQLRPEESLLIACRSYQPACAGHHPRITLKKIPQLLLGRCEFGRDDYSLHIVQVPSTPESVEDEQAEEAAPAAAPKPKQGQLF